MKRQSQWLFLDAADQLITVRESIVVAQRFNQKAHSFSSMKSSRKRVFVQPSDKEYQSTPEMTCNRTLVGDLPDNIRLVLEEQPKWKLLQDILDEIEEDVTTNTIQGIKYLVFVFIQTERLILDPFFH